MLVIDRRFNGPPNSGNGGYSCGVFASLIDGPAEVTLRIPPPLDTPFTVARADGVAHVMHGTTVVAEARPATLDVEPPSAVSFDDAKAAETPVYPPEHPFPTCFVCGTERTDGLSIFAGPVEGGEVLAAPWIPAEDLSDQAGTVRREFVWASLDCPSGYAAWIQRNDRIVLGRLAASVLASSRSGEPHVVVAWPIGADGRKRFSGSALYGADGELKAVARATWISLA